MLNLKHYLLSVALVVVVAICFATFSATASQQDLPRCPHDTEPIEEFATVDKLLAEYESIEGACRDLWLEPLQELKDVLEATSKDICSEESVEALSRFHWKWVVGTIEKSWRLASKKPTPGAVRIFFMHYADELAEKCRQHVGRRLEQAIGGRHIETDSLPSEPLGKLISRLKLTLIPEDEVRKYSDFFLLWNSLLDMQRRKGRPLVAEGDAKFNLLTGEQVYASLKVRDPIQATVVQEKCRRNLRPIYGATILPLMYLADMGYGNMEVKMEEHERALLSHWYGLTQVCQLLLPIHFSADSELEPDQVAIVSREELEALSEDPPTAGAVQPALVGSIVAKPVEPVSFGEVRLADAYDIRVGKRIKATIESRGSIYRRIFWNVLRALKAQFKDMIKKVLFRSWDRKSRAPNEHDNELMVESALGMAEQELREDEAMSSGIEKGKMPARTRRDLILYQPQLNPVFMEAMAVITAGVWIAVIVWGIIILISPVG